MKEDDDQNDEGYVGNVFGWKTSFMSLILIVGLLLIMFARYRYLVSTGQWEQKKEKTETIEFY